MPSSFLFVSYKITLRKILTITVERLFFLYINLFLYIIYFIENCDMINSKVLVWHIFVLSAKKKKVWVECLSYPITLWRDMLLWISDKIRYFMEESETSDILSTFPFLKIKKYNMFDIISHYDFKHWWEGWFIVSEGINVLWQVGALKAFN